MKHVNRRAQSSVQGWGSYLKYVLLELTSLEFMRFDSIIIILTIVTYHTRYECNFIV